MVAAGVVVVCAAAEEDEAGGVVVVVGSTAAAEEEDDIWAVEASAGEEVVPAEVAAGDWDEELMVLVGLGDAAIESDNQ